MIKQSDIDRFNSKIEKLESGCWIFIGAKDEHGYGAFHSNTYRRAHRFSWFMHHGLIPDGLFVLHKCDNPPCIRVDHLYLGDYSQNTKDMMDRNRQSTPKITYIGEQSKAARITNEQALHIKKLLEEGICSSKIARIVDVSNHIVYRIKTKKCWKHLNIKTPDDDRKNKFISGENHWRSKLKEKDVIKIRELLTTNSMSQKQLSLMFSVSIKMIDNIYKNKNWKHVNEQIK